MAMTSMAIALSLPLFLDFSCHCWIGILGFSLGLLELLLFGFVEVFVQLFLFGILLLDAQNAGFLFNYFLGFCSTLILLIGTIF